MADVTLTRPAPSPAAAAGPPRVQPELPAGGVPHQRQAQAEHRQAPVVRRGFTFPGAVGAILLFCLSLTPSLLPRDWLVQGVLSGITMALGYGAGAMVGAMVGAVASRLWRRLPPVRGRHWTVLVLAALVLASVFLTLAGSWQDEVRRLVGAEAAPGAMTAPMVSLALVVFLLLLVASRLVRLAARALAGTLGRVSPRPVAAVAAAVTVAVAGYAAGHGILVSGFLDVATDRAARANASLAAGVTAPASGHVSGGPGSLVPWHTLGAAGRQFIADAVPQHRLAAFSRHGARPPIRVYVGVDSAPSAADRAALAVLEMDRTGGFDRSVVAVITTTGTGWVNPDVARALEYLHAGDSALVAVQYSYLPSWISFLSDRSTAAESAGLLIAAVRERIAAVPAGQRPRLVVYGESLGAHGVERAFADLAELTAATDGALLVGPPHANPIWRALTEQRDPDSPMWRPTLQHGAPVRFAQEPADLRLPRADRPGVIYLQNATDPIVWWSPRLLWHRPAWLGPERGPGVSSAMRWLPVVTFWQVTADLVASTAVPSGHGHSYGPSAADAWAALVPPPGWSEADTVRLRRLLS